MVQRLMRKVKNLGQVQPEARDQPEVEEAPVDANVNLLYQLNRLQRFRQQELPGVDALHQLFLHQNWK